MPKKKKVQKKVLIIPPLWKRVLAFILDLLLINAIVGVPFQSIFSKILLAKGSLIENIRALQASSQMLSMLNTIFLFVTIFTFFYFVLMEYTIGQTVGKIIFNIRVLSEDGDLKFFQSCIRSLFLISIFPLSLIWIFDMIYFFFFSKQQRLTEYLSRSRVVMGDVL